MFLRDFYENSDGNNRRRWIIIGLVTFSVLAFIAFTISMFHHQPTQNDVEQFISKSSTLRELDRFCSDLPKPPNFKYRYKKLAGNSQTAYISYRYQSDSSFSEVRDFYIAYLEKEGWTNEHLWDEERSALPKFLEYRKGDRTISLERVNFPDADYSLGCGFDL